MNHTKLKYIYILIEGSDDKRFVDAVVKKCFEGRYGKCVTYEYAQRSNKEVCALLKGINNIHADYVFICDLDRAPCCTSRKHKVRERFPFLDEGRILIAAKEIEAWYLAGLDRDSETELGVPHHKCTDWITKAHFDKSMPHGFFSRVDFMREILKRFCIDVAAEKNVSFKYCVGKLEKSVEKRDRDGKSQLKSKIQRT